MHRVINHCIADVTSSRHSGRGCDPLEVQFELQAQAPWHLKVRYSFQAALVLQDAGTNLSTKSARPNSTATSSLLPRDAKLYPLLFIGAFRADADRLLYSEFSFEGARMGKKAIVDEREVLVESVDVQSGKRAA